MGFLSGILEDIEALKNDEDKTELTAEEGKALVNIAPTNKGRIKYFGMKPFLKEGLGNAMDKMEADKNSWQDIYDKEIKGR